MPRKKVTKALSRESGKAQMEAQGQLDAAVGLKKKPAVAGNLKAAHSSAKWADTLGTAAMLSRALPRKRPARPKMYSKKLA